MPSNRTKIPAVTHGTTDKQDGTGPGGYILCGKQDRPGWYRGDTNMAQQAVPYAYLSGFERVGTGYQRAWR